MDTCIRRGSLYGGFHYTIKQEFVNDFFKYIIINIYCYFNTGVQEGLDIRLE